MGCPVSKPDDSDRQRAPTSQFAGANAGGTPANAHDAYSGQGLSAGDAYGAADSPSRPRTYTDQQLDENEDFFNAIIQRTTDNLIDINQQSVSGKTGVDRAEEYSALAKVAVSSSSSASASARIEGTPISSVLATLQAPSAASQIAEVCAVAERIASAVGAVQTTDVGPIVVEL